MISFDLSPTVEVGEINIDDVNIGLAELRVEVAETNVVYGNESINMANLYLVSERIDYDISNLTPGTESFMSAVMHGIETMFKKIIDFMTNIFKYVFKLFKRIYDFIMGLFKKRDKSGGGGGSIRDRVEKKKTKVEEEIEEIKKEPTKNQPGKFETYIDKYRNSIAEGLKNHASFFNLPIKSDKKIDVQDIIYYLETIEHSYRNTIQDLTSEILGTKFNIFTIFLRHGKDSNIFKVLHSVIDEFNLESKYEPSTADFVHKAITKDLRKNINALRDEITAISKVLATMTSDNFEQFKVKYNNKDIVIPDEIKSLQEVEDSVLDNNKSVIRTLVSVTKTKFFYLTITYDKALEDEISKGLDETYEMLDINSKNTYSKEEALNSMVNLLEVATRAFSLNFKSYEVTNNVPDINDIRDMVKDIDLTEAATSKLIDQSLAVYEHIKDDSSKFSKHNEKLIKRHEKDMDAMLDEVKHLEKASKLYSDVVSTTSMNSINNLASTVSKIIRNVNTNTITPLKDFVGLTKDNSDINMRFLATDFDEKYLEIKGSNYSMLNLIVDLYSLQKMENARMMYV